MRSQPQVLDGYKSYGVLEPELKLGLVALVNERDPATSKAHHDLLNTILFRADLKAVTLP